MKILTCFSKTEQMSFEEAVYRLPIADYCQRKGHSLSNFDIYAWKSNVVDDIAVFNYIYRHINELQPHAIILPITSNRAINYVLDPVRIKFNTKIAYLLTGDLSDIHSIVSIIPKSALIICQNRAQAKFAASKSFENIIELFPVLNEYVFYRDDSIMQDESRDQNNDNVKKAVQEHIIDVSFFGKYTEERHAMLKTLVDKYDVRAYGHGWADPFNNEFEKDGIKTALRKNLTFERQILTRSRITVIISEVIKPIHFEAPACNSLPIAYDEIGEIAGYFKGIEYPTFKTEKSLKSTVDRFMADYTTRQEVRSAIRRYIHENYSSEKFCDLMFEKLI